MKQMLSSALFAGIAAGLLGALLQYILVQPDIVLAERYESGELVHFQGVAAEGQGDAGHDMAAMEEEAEPSLWHRQGLTLAFSLFTWCGFALILTGAMRATEALGHRISPAAAALWGLGGFLAFQMLPALGLPPELPGTPGADLTARQMWWLATVLASGAGLWALAYGRALWHRIGGAGVVALPHLWGAPEAEVMGGIVPPELASGFAAHALGIGLITWLALGLLIPFVGARNEVP